MRRWRIVLHISAPCLLPVLLACGDRAESATPRQAGAPRGATASSGAGALTATAMAEFTVDTATVELPLELSAQLYVEHDVVVVARSAGTVDSLFVELGDRVRPGQRLARLESGEQEIALASADAAYDNLVRVAGRARALVRAGGVTSADSERVELELRQAEIARRKARRDVELTRVNAPFEGVVTTRLVRPRRYVSAGDTLFRVTESRPLFARIRVPQASGRLVRVGQSAVVVSDAGGQSPGVIVNASPIIDAASGTREAVLSITRPQADLMAGSNVIVRLGRERRRVLSVPRDAIAPEGYALVVENGRSTLRAVTIGGPLEGGRVEVLSGLSVGERLARPVR